ncbi:MAG: DUF1850 domain-containing protein [Spirochaetaceae bacterium]|jgi:hypothetical protein|nr:DUF1850 domain-containing protein [Spirochaetaceae bacterium]
MRQKWYGLIINLVLAALVVSGAVFLRGLPKKLVISDASSGRVYGTWRVAEGAEFAVEFIHSVHNSPVRDTFRVRGRRIKPVATRFSSFGAGMQAELGEGQEMIRDGDALVITGFSQSYKRLNLIVGTVSDHLLFIDDESISLRDLCGKNAHIVVRIR